MITTPNWPTMSRRARYEPLPKQAVEAGGTGSGLNGWRRLEEEDEKNEDKDEEKDEEGEDEERSSTSLIYPPHTISRSHLSAPRPAHRHQIGPRPSSVAPICVVCSLHHVVIFVITVSTAAKLCDIQSTHAPSSLPSPQ